MILKLLHLLQVQQLFACYQLQFPRQNPSDLEVILVIGGKRTLNGTYSTSVEVINQYGNCDKHKLSLPIPICDPAAIKLETSVLVCGWKYCTSTLSQGKDVPACMVWKKGSSEPFKELSQWSVRLPTAYGSSSSTPKFDFHHSNNGTVYFRPWGARDFWKGKIDDDDRMVWEKRAGLPINVDYSCSVIFMETLYIIGGRWLNAEGTPRYSASMFRYLETTDDKEIGWSVETPLDVPLFNMTCYSSSDDGILVFGGETVNNTNPIQSATSVRFWSAKFNSWTVNDSRWKSFEAPRFGAGVSELTNPNWHRELILFGGHDPLTLPRNPRFLNTPENYDPVLQEWYYPGWNLKEGKSDMAVVKVPAYWIPECFKYKNSSNKIESKIWFLAIIVILFVLHLTYTYF